MNRLTATLLALVALPTLAAADAHRYGIKSGVITFETPIKMGTMTSTQKTIVYFDDYGAKEARDDFDGDAVRETTLCDGKTSYRLKHKAKTARVALKHCDGTEITVAKGHLPKAKALPAVTIAGKPCDAFEQAVGKTGHVTYAGWKGILLQTVTTTGSTTLTTTATKLEEVDVPASKFTLPADYQLEKK
jgi:hypothetical protein